MTQFYGTEACPERELDGTNAAAPMQEEEFDLGVDGLNGEPFWIVGLL
jgi:hypothetical protein